MTLHARSDSRKDLLHGTLDMLILRTLQWGPQHGYAIGQTIRAQSSDVLQVEAGSLYPALQRLAKKGWVTAKWGQTEANQRAKFYRLTPEGKKFVDDFTKQNDRMPSYAENYCYVTAQIFREVLDRNPEAGDNREKFRDALSAFKSKESTSGVSIEFDKNGARKEYMYFMQIKDVGAKEYSAKQMYYIEWDAEVLPVYDLVK